MVRQRSAPPGVAFLQEEEAMSKRTERRDKAKLNDKLDQALRDTFPASDPVALLEPAPAKPADEPHPAKPKN
jgi:hypothetical protein